MNDTDKIKGRLIAFEGVDGAGITTQIKLVHQWLLGLGCRVFYSEWNSSEIVKEATGRGKKQQIFTPMTYSLVYATDFADRYDRQILPMLKAGFLVLCDRYTFTSFARDAVRGCDPVWLRELYNFAYKPDIVFYLDLPVHVALDRLAKSREKINYFEAGMDLRLSQDIFESYRLFQGRVHDQYLTMARDFGFTLVDAGKGIHEQQAAMREKISKAIQLSSFKERTEQ
jgi:dTMP kinase